MKKIVSIVLALCMIFTMLPFYAIAQENVEQTTDTEWEYSFYGNGVELTAYNGNATDVYIPGSITVDDTEYAVLKLADSIFEDNDSLNSVTLGVGILEIGDRAFYDCDNMVCILLAEETTTIGNEAFYSCDAFNSVILYDAVTSIGENAFFECPKLVIWCNEDSVGHNYAINSSIPYKLMSTNAEPEIYNEDGFTYYIFNGEAIVTDYSGTETSVTIPSIINNYPVTKLRGTFTYNKTIKNANLPETIKIIDIDTFKGCNALESIYISDSVTQLGANVFADCASLKEVRLSNNIISLPNYAFCGCTSLAEFNIPNNIINVGDYVFYKCTSLRSITIPDSVTWLGKYAFEECTALIEVEIPNSIKKINTGLFAKCYALKKVVIPETVTTIGVMSFLDCYNLSEIDISNVQELNYEAFSGCVSLKEVTISGRVAVIGDYCFYGCTALKTVMLNEGTTKIGIDAFNGCTNLSMVLIPKSVTDFGAYYSFAVNTVVVVYEGSGGHSYALRSEHLYHIYDGLNMPEVYTLDGFNYFVANGEAMLLSADANIASTNIVIPDNVSGYPVTAIGPNAFYQNATLQSIKLPNQLKTIGQKAFYGCCKLYEIDFPDSLSKIEDYAFYGCSSLRTLYLNNSTFSIGNNTFSFSNAINFIHINSIEQWLKVPNIFSAANSSGNLYINGELLTAVTIPDNITKLPSYAFTSCNSLSKVVIPSTITEIGNYAFSNCSNLKEITFQGDLTKLGMACFNLCKSLTEIIIPNGVTEIGDYAFKECGNLSKVIIPGTATRIGNNAFYNCKKLEEITIPDSVNYLGEKAFYACESLKTVKLSDNITEINEETFYNCLRLKNIIFGKNLTVIKGYAFYRCYNLIHLEFPDSLTDIYSNAFTACSGLSSITFGKNLKNIQANAFSSCTSLNGKTIILPENVTITKSSFTDNVIFLVHEDATVLIEQIESLSLMYFTYNDTNVPESVTYEGIIYLISNSEAIAIDCDGSIINAVIPNMVNGVYVTKLHGTFSGNTNLKTVVLPTHLREIGDDSFYKCTSLTDVNIPESVTYIGRYAFAYCEKLKSINIPENISVINTGTFYLCKSLTTIILPKNLTAIKYSAFQYCTSLSEMSLPKKLTEIGEGAFKGCYALTEIVLPDSLIKMGKSVFEECRGLTYAVLPKYLRELPDGTFSGCTNLKTVDIPYGYETIRSSVFSGCTSLTEITLPDTIDYIGTAAFGSCKLLEKIVLPSKLWGLGNSAFSHCESLKEIFLPSTLTEYGSDVFSYCYSLEIVRYEEGTTKAKATGLSYYTPNIKKMFLPSSITDIKTKSGSATTIYIVESGSHAQEWAISNNLLYFVMRQTENPEIAYGAGVSGTVRYSDGTVASGATVEILYDDGVSKETVITDSKGAYEFTYAEVGRYTIRVTDADSNTASTTVGVKRMNVFDVFVAGDTDLVLKNSYSISGIVNEVGATVTLTDTEGNVIESITADENGNFVFENIPNGEYIVKAETVNGSVIKEITVFNSNVTGIELVIETETSSVWGYVEVEDRDGKQNRRNWVQVTIYNDDGVAVDQCKTDKDGKYSFSNLPLGDYVIVAETSEMRPDKKHGYDRSHTLTGYAYVEVTELKDYEVDTIVLYEENDEKADIVGKVTAKGNINVSEVILANIFGDEIDAVTTGKNGKFVFKNVADGMYFIYALTENDGFGFAVVVVRNGNIYGDTHIKVEKHSYIQTLEDSFKYDVPECNSKDDALIHKERIAQEKHYYDSLSKKEKKQLSKEYVERLNKYTEWLADCEYTANDGVTVEQGGLVVSQNEINEEANVTFTINVEKTDTPTTSEDGINNIDDHKNHSIKDKAGKKEIMQYYEITMTKSTADGDKAITSVYKDTDSNGKFRITLTIPEEYRGYKHYSFVHEHYGEVVTLTDLDNDPDTVTFEVDKFSTFALTATNEEQGSELLSGDINMDGNVNATDITQLRKVLFGKAQVSDILADVSNDDSVNILDLVVAKKITLQ